MFICDDAPLFLSGSPPLRSSLERLEKRFEDPSVLSDRRNAAGRSLVSPVDAMERVEVEGRPLILFFPLSSPVAHLNAWQVRRTSDVAFPLLPRIQSCLSQESIDRPDVPAHSLRFALG